MVVFVVLVVESLDYGGGSPSTCVHLLALHILADDWTWAAYDLHIHNNRGGRGNIAEGGGRGEITERGDRDKTTAVERGAASQRIGRDMKTEREETRWHSLIQNVLAHSAHTPVCSLAGLPRKSPKSKSS